MDTRSIKEAGFIARFIHIVILGAIVAPGIVFRSRTLIAILTAVWFVIFAFVYLLVTRRDHQRRGS